MLPEPAAQHVLGCNNKLELEECHAALSRTLSALVSPLTPAPSPSADGLLRLDLLGVLAMGSMQKARLGLGIPLHPQPHLQPGSPPGPRTLLIHRFPSYGCNGPEVHRFHS